MQHKHRRTRAILIVLSLIFGFALIQAPAQSASQTPEIPDSPSAVMAQNSQQHPWLQAKQSGAPAAQSQSQAQSSETHKPVGTAVAESPATVGVAASNPAGAAIAPPKQRRVRTLLIKVGAVVGAGVAIGTVVALASASPSTPPGSR